MFPSVFAGIGILCYVLRIEMRLSSFECVCVFVDLKNFTDEACFLVFFFHITTPIYRIASQVEILSFTAAESSWEHGHYLSHTFDMSRCALCENGISETKRSALALLQSKVLETRKWCRTDQP